MKNPLGGAATREKDNTWIAANRPEILYPLVSSVSHSLELLDWKLREGER